MILNIDVEDKEFQVTSPSRPKIDQLGIQRIDKETGQPLWMTEVVVTDHSGGEIIKISTAGEKPDLDRGDPIEVFGLVGVPWVSGSRAGMAFRADSIKPIDD